MISTGGAVTSSFVCDPRGRLFESTINGTKTQFLYDGDALIAEFNGSNVMQRRYVHGNRADEPLIQYNSNAIGASARRYLHADHQGSIIAHSDVNGNVLAKLAYDSFGIPAAGNTDRFGYTGQAWFKELGLFHYKARFYHPKIGRFMQTDPIGYKDDMNLYAYTGNDPLNKTDPTGQYAVITYKKDGRVHISVPTKFSGVGATAGNISAIKSSVSSTWSNTYNINGVNKNVSVEVTDVSKRDKKYNEITLTNGPTSHSDGISFVSSNNRAGEWNVSDPNFTNGIAAHEAGHLIGAEDHYSESTDPNGVRTTAPDPGFESNLMGTIPGATNDSNMNEIINNKRNKIENEK